LGFPIYHKVLTALYERNWDQLYSPSWGLAYRSVQGAVVLFGGENTFDPKKERASDNCPKVLRVSNLISKNIQTILELTLIVLLYDSLGQRRAPKHNVLMRRIWHHSVKFSLLRIHKLEWSFFSEVDQLHGFWIELD
jgi:hypothetical protein